jgi:hypothetical protein
VPWIFGPAFPGHDKAVEIRELKKMDAQTRAKAFKSRADAFLVKQVDHFQTPSIWAPFPLAVMTCIGIEMVGSYRYGDARNDRNDHFKRTVEDIDAGFSVEQFTPMGERKKLSYFIYQGFRNSLALGYYGQWVFITHQKEKSRSFRYSSKRNLVVLNVYWFYEQFKKTYNEYFSHLLAATDSKQDPLKILTRPLRRNWTSGSGEW